MRLFRLGDTNLWGFRLDPPVSLELFFYMIESAVMPPRPEPKPGEPLKAPEMSIIPPRAKPVQDIKDLLPKEEEAQEK